MYSSTLHQKPNAKTVQLVSLKAVCVICVFLWCRSSTPSLRRWGLPAYVELEPALLNRQRRQGVELFEAVSNAGVVRFRPIILTSVTTFVGLIPLMTDTDPETFMFIPMAISLAFGVLFATAITLFLVPSLYLMLEDWLRFWGQDSRKDDTLKIRNTSQGTSL